MEAYSPPTAKLAFQSDKIYHVFLSFRGADVRKTLVDHLYQALSAAGLNVFIDSEKLKNGEIIDLSLERAIESSAIRIPVFSRGYAASAWCLKEAAAMLMSPGLIIPLFYHVEPTHVRYPLSDSSPYKPSFLKHYDHSDRYTREVVDGWKNALGEICTRSGWTMALTQGYEARLVKTVVKDLIETLDGIPLEVAEHPVEIDHVKNLLIQKLDLNAREEVLKIGIWGIGGSGKTTVAKALYNQIRGDFEAVSFVSDVCNSGSKATGRIKPQKQILEELVQYDGQVHSVAKGISLFKDRLGGKRVLLILDDIDAVEQLKALVGDWFAPGSRVIINSRNKHILNVAGADYIHEMSGLGADESLQLFSWHAFLRATPSQNLLHLSKRVVEACKGHPLSLKMIGSFLHDKQDNKDCWLEAVYNIVSNQNIYDRLRISYDGLSDEEQKIFLDIACFFIGDHKRSPIIFWKSLYKKVDTAIENLKMKLLINIGDGDVFDMHDHLRDMGHIIAGKMSTRLWEAVHSSINMSDSISHLRVRGGNPQRLESLYSSSLRYLYLQNVDIECMTNDTLAMLPPSLIWLRLENCGYPTRSMNTVQKKSRHSRILGNIWQLKTLQITSCEVVESRRISSLFSLPNIQLQHLYLEECDGLNNLHDTIDNLSQLESLNLNMCRKLNNLPRTIGNLSLLQDLDLSNCTHLNYLPDTVGNLSQLRRLNLNYCLALTDLPDTFGDLSQLQHLDLSSCKNLNRLPDTFGNLSELQWLNLSDCDKLEGLPDSFDNLSKLHYLDLRYCDSLNNLLNTINKLSQLQNLNLYCSDTSSQVAELEFDLLPGLK